MASTTLQNLKKIIEKAYEDGYHGCCDLKTSYADEAIKKIVTEEPPPLTKNDGWKIFTARELQRAELGRIFDHVIMGKGYIDVNQDYNFPYSRCMKWSNGDISHFLTDEFPWTEMMKELGFIIKSAGTKKKKRA